MRKTSVTILIVVFLLFHLQAQRGTLSRATEEIESLVRQALEDRINARSLPDFNLLADFNLLGGSTSIALREEMPVAAMRLTDAALPRLEGYQVRLMSSAEAQAMADKMGRPFSFLIADRPVIAGDNATISLGVDLLPPREPNAVKLCCCVGHGEFRRVERRWVFLKWGEIACS